MNRIDGTKYIVDANRLVAAILTSSRPTIPMDKFIVATNEADFFEMGEHVSFSYDLQPTYHQESKNLWEAFPTILAPPF